MTTININTALGMTETPSPFKVGDWVELKEGKGDGHWHLEHAAWPQRIVKFDSLGNVCFDNSGPWSAFRFRLATPPDEVGSLREQLAAVTKGLDRMTWLHDLQADCCKAALKKRDELRDKLAATEAEAAAMRKCVERTKEILDQCGPERWGYTLERLNERCVKALDTTAGRELLDRHAKEITAKDERIADVPAPVNDEMNIKKIDSPECNCGGTIMSMALQIEEQAKQLAAQAPLVRIAEELRELLSGVDPLDAEADVRIVVKHEDDGERLMGILKQLRDMKGGV
jgi:hypothetical protein